ncbi:hypothetical protein CcCBS67573_g09231 [Chytriomyces confervae]|uniref:Uncharacterized protein n=1 Tax=Chytriomyces confervae TaxID=246404 RepID=A0A507E0I3_9FUNG|nr:hypothetical protein HDU80_011659 [Chytriomyces hyalinus]TPX57619.1 hypothetical protein CcCBS67573_g09231 [Chytriomyces confervae]
MSAALQTPTVAAVFVSAMAFESASKGLVLSLNKFAETRAPVPAIMVVANVLSLMFAPVYVWSILSTTDCNQVATAFKVCMHMFFPTFSFFLLYKTWIVSQKRRTVAVCAAILMLNRCTWAVLDIFQSKAIQTPVGCFYLQDKVTIVGISSGGLLIDLFCTGVTIMSAFRDVDRDTTPSKLQKVYQVLVADNVLRSVSIMAVNGFTLNYAVCSSLQVIPGTPSVMILIPSVSGFVYTQALNVEFFWLSVRNGIMRADEGKDIRITSARLVDEKDGSRC